jgi:hypothetical protein
MDLAVVAVASLTWEMFDFGNNRVPRSEYSMRRCATSSRCRPWGQLGRARKPPTADEFRHIPGHRPCCVCAQEIRAASRAS